MYLALPTVMIALSLFFLCTSQKICVVLRLYKYIDYPVDKSLLTIEVAQELPGDHWQNQKLYSHWLNTSSYMYLRAGHIWVHSVIVM